MSNSTRFTIPDDGIHACQVCIFDADDLAYWKDQVDKSSGMVMIFSYHVGYAAIQPFLPEHDVYQIVPMPDLLNSEGIEL